MIIITKIFNFLMPNKNNNLLKKIYAIKNGNEELRNKLINDYKPFIARCVSYVLNYKYVDQNDCDEFSIGLIAFNDAINSFDKNKGTSFIDFAQLIITRKVINYRIQAQKHSASLPFSSFEKDDKTFVIENKQLLFENSKNLDLKDELSDYKDKLKKFNINIWELVEISPKHKDSIDNCIKISKILVQNEFYYKNFLKTKLLPVKFLVKESGFSRKTIERNRKYIISTVLLLDSNLTIMKEFLN